MSAVVSGAVDAHHHFWDPSRASYPWLDPSWTDLNRAFGVDDLRPLAQRNGITETVLVQTRPSVDETREFLAVAGTSPLVAGVVGWVDLTDPGVPAAIDALRAAEGGSRLVGIRHQVHDEPDPDWLSRPDVRRGIRAVADAGLVFDLLLRPRELPAGLAVARAFPDTRFVVDHLAKPPVATHEIEPWASLLRPFGELENVSAKVSGLVTEADWRSWETQDLRRYVDHALEVFGPQRLLFGSDWPVCLLAASYDRVVASARSLLTELSAGERDAVFGSNARSVYRLPAQV